MNTLNRFIKDEEGATAIEYGLIAALISVGILGILSTLGDDLENTFTNVSTSLQTANTAGGGGGGGGTP